MSLSACGLDAVAYPIGQTLGMPSNPPAGARFSRRYRRSPMTARDFDRLMAMAADDRSGAVAIRAKLIDGDPNVA